MSTLRGLTADRGRTNSATASGHCGQCPDRMICRCLGVTESDVLEALTVQAVKTVTELRCQTGAGGGCMACHRTLARYVERHAYAEAGCDL